MILILKVYCKSSCENIFNSFRVLNKKNYRNISSLTLYKEIDDLNELVNFISKQYVLAKKDVNYLLIYPIFFFTLDEIKYLNKKFLAGLINLDIDEFEDLSERAIEKSLINKFSYFEDEIIYIGEKSSIIVAEDFKEILDYLDAFEISLYRFVKIREIYNKISNFIEKIHRRIKLGKLQILKSFKWIDEINLFKIELLKSMEEVRIRIASKEYLLDLCRRLESVLGIDEIEESIGYKIEILDSILHSLNNKVDFLIFFILEFLIVVLFIIELIKY